MNTRRAHVLSNGTMISAPDIDALAVELDAIRARIEPTLGARELRYLRQVMRVQRFTGIAGRALLFLGFIPPFFVLGVALLALSKILENMEIGHNVMHGQYEFTREPSLVGRTYEWDMLGPSESWREVHNQIHHVHTNIVEVDRDVGYGFMRISELQPWHPRFLLQPLHNIVLALFFEWGISFHGVPLKPFFRGQETFRELLTKFAPLAKKALRQLLKDYVLFPLLAGPNALIVLVGNFLANTIRNVWAYAVIYCGHFPEGVATYTERETENESRGEWYLRQMDGSSNLEGGPVFHILTGNLSHQIEHHLFPDLPACRYAEIACEVRSIARRYGLPYHSGPMTRQLASVAKRICVLSLPPTRTASVTEHAA